MADVYTFSQNDLHSTSFTAFDEMRRKGQFCDLAIKVQNHTIIAHKIIVAAGIPYFQSAFGSTDSSSEEKEIAVHDNLDPKALESLILFAYTSKIDITAENVQSVLIAAHFLELDLIRDSCTEFLSKCLNIHNVVQIRELANNLNNSRLIDNCKSYIRKNFADFSKTLHFLKLSHSCVKDILSEDDLVVSTEEVVFEAVIGWVKFSPIKRQVDLPDLLNEVRMVFLPIPYLMKRVDSEELIINSKPCRDLINEVKYYHLLPQSAAEFVHLKTRPRNRFLQNLYAVCSCQVSGSLKHFVFISVNEKWHVLSFKELESSAHNVAAINRKIYMFLDDIVVHFDIGNQEWKLLESSRGDIGIVGAATALHEENIYCFGSANGDFINQMRIFDTQSNKWSRTKAMKTRRSCPAAASLGEFIYVTGGHDRSVFHNTVEKYCPSRDEWRAVAPMLFQRNSHGCCSMNEKILVSGGMYAAKEYSVHYSEIYDPATNQWMKISPISNGMIMKSLVLHGGKMYAFGRTGSEVYNPETNEWNEFPLVPMELRGGVSISTYTTQNDAT